MYVLMANRVGIEASMDFSGESVLASPDGNTVFVADDSECMLVGEADFARAAELREEKQYLALRCSNVFEVR